MKKISFWLLSILCLPVLSFSQAFDYQLTGNPVDITGWTMATLSQVNGDQIELTQPVTTQSGYIYYSTPSQLSDCSQFTVEFDFSITQSSSPTADGIAFWYISNPPTGFVSGGGIGLPANPNGLLVILDTYDNDNAPTFYNPRVSLRRLDGTSNYDESTTTGQLTPDAINQSFITDGNWHSCVIQYLNGNVTVSFDGNAPLLTGITDLTGFNGYFGFSAGTGASWALHAIKNVHIYGAPNPEAPDVEDVTYCLDAPAVPLTAGGSTLHWYTSPTGGTELPGAPTPNTSVPGTYTWYVSQSLPNCTIESQRAAINVFVSAPPVAPNVNYDDHYCQGEDYTGVVVSGQNPLWYETATGGTGAATAPVLDTDIPGTYTWYVSQTISGCESIDRTAVTITVQEAPIASFDMSLHYGCTADTLLFSNSSTLADSFFWNFGDGGTSTATNPVHIFLEQGIYTIKLVAQSGVCKDSTTQEINTLHPLDASFYANDDTICAESAVTFTNFSTTTTIGGLDPVYHWDLGDGNTQDGSATFSHVYTDPGVYTVVLSVTDGVPCTDTSVKVITVDPFATISIDQDDSLICTGQRIGFTANYEPAGFQRLKWTFSDNNDTTLDVNPVTHAYDQTGNFTVTAQATYRSCPEVSAVVNVAVRPIPLINIAEDDSLCFHGEPIVLTDAVNTGNPNAHWSWSNGDTSSTIIARHHGTYRATVTVDGCSNSDEVRIYKDCYIDIPNTFTPNGDGLNDYFLPRQLLAEGLIGFNMKIWNRWGQVIFETENVNGRGWDGMLNGKDQPAGVYIYLIETVMKNGTREQYNGNVTLLR